MASLESELSVAEESLGVKVDNGKEQYLPVDSEDPNREVVIEEGQVYLYGQSGERKPTGTYHTETHGSTG